MHLKFVQSPHFSFFEVLQRLVPHRMIGADKIRLGRAYDGGYVMIDDFKGLDAAYSIGINDDVSWDLDMVGRGVPVFQYDHTIADTPRRHDLMLWRQVGLGAAASPDDKINTLQGMLSENGHLGNRNLILKCDIEGHEWEVFANISPSIVDQFRQITMEVHAFEYVDEEAVANNISKSIENLTRSHFLVHVHANNFSSWNIDAGVPFPNVMEMTFVRKDRGRFEPSGEVFPTAIDMPCDPTKPDYYLGTFTYPEPGMLRSAPGQKADRHFIASSYELFLGRQLESEDVVRDRGGWPKREVLRSIIGSAEFASRVLEPLDGAHRSSSDIFAGRPTRTLIYWAADYLPLTAATKGKIGENATWRQLLGLILADPDFAREAGLLQRAA